MKHTDQEYLDRRAAEPESIRRAALTNPIVCLCLHEYRAGLCSLVEALAKAVNALIEQNATLMHAEFERLLREPVMVPQ